MDWHDIASIKHFGTSLGDRSGSEMASITSWALNVHCQTHMVVVQRLNSNRNRRCVGDCGGGGLTEVIPDTE